MKSKTSVMIDPYNIINQLGINTPDRRSLEPHASDILFLHGVKDELRGYGFIDVEPKVNIYTNKGKYLGVRLLLDDEYIEIMSREPFLWGNLKEILQESMISYKLWNFAKKEAGSVKMKLELLLPARLVIVKVI